MSAPQSKQKGDALSIAFVRLHVVSLVGSKAYRAGSSLKSGPRSSYLRRQLAVRPAIGTL